MWGRKERNWQSKEAYQWHSVEVTTKAPGSLYWCEVAWGRVLLTRPGETQRWNLFSDDINVLLMALYSGSSGVKLEVWCKRETRSMI